MKISLTWATYAQIIGAFIVCYYVVILVVFHRKKLQKIIASNTFKVVGDHSNSEGQRSSSALFEEENLHGNVAEEQQDLWPLAQNFTDELQALTISSGPDIAKDELASNIRKIRSKYPLIVGSEYQYELKNVIATCSELNCSIHFTAEELNDLWYK